MGQAARFRKCRNRGLGLLVLAVASLLVGTAAWGQEWELRVCAEPHNFPVSSRADGGFNNQIAAVLADELGAELTFEWTRFSGADVERTLLSGGCDAIIGIAEGASGTLTTVPYLRAPYVFMSKEASGVDVTSLDDEALAVLRIGTYQTGIPSIALRNRGIEENVFEYPPIASPGGPDRDTAVLDALVQGEVDVAIVYAPAAAARAALESEKFRIVPVTPEVDTGETLIHLFRTWTIGVRPNDEAFRDRLNLALAERWDEVQAVIDGYGLPQLSIGRPSVPTELPPRGVAVIAPLDSGGHVPLKSIGTPAQLGAKLAESTIARDERHRGTGFRVLYASAPTDEAAIRAAGRLVATENLFAFIGGFGENQALRLGEIAAEGNVLFFNVASVSDRLRGDLCSPTTFHVEASESMYLDVLVDWFVAEGARRFFVVHEDSERGASLAERTARTVERAHEAAGVVGRAPVEQQRFVYADVMASLIEAQPEVVTLLLRPADQEVFLSQFPSEGLAAAVTGLPYPVSQTREYLFRFRDVASVTGMTPRAALWETSITEGDAGDVNESFLARNGAPMEPTAWATYASVLILFHAVTEIGSHDTSALISHLEAPDTSFQVGKGADVSFRPWDHQLRQPLYLVRVDENASWGRSARARVEFGRLVAQRPERSSAPISRQALDRFGDNAAASTCRF
jgi:ABC transporter substrate binding protein (PQQ-dependent alcohol dehydrogenase system)